MNRNPGESAEPVSKRRKANRENAKKSTGPKTAKGKARSSKNAYKHGYRARTPAHFYEDRAGCQERRDAFFNSLAPTDIIEATLVDMMATSAWRLERMIKCETAILAKKAFEAADLFEVESEDQLRANIQGLSSNPRHFARLLRTTMKGCTWIYERLYLLTDTLEKRKFWYPTERDHVLNIFGLNTEDLFFDTLAYDIVEAFASAGWSTEINGDVLRLQALIQSGAPAGMSTWEYRHRVEGLAKAIKETQPDPEQSRAKLTAILRAEMEMVEKKRPFLYEHEKYLQGMVVDRSGVDTSLDGQLRMRYESMHKRDFRNALRDFQSQRKLNPDGEICEHEAIGPPLAEAMVEAPNEAIEASELKGSPMPEPVDKDAHIVCSPEVAKLEEAGAKCKKTVGIPLRPVEEYIHRTSPTPSGLYRRAARVEADQKKLEEEKMREM